MVIAGILYCTQNPSGLSIPSLPTGITANGISASSIRVTWTAVSGATSYKIYRSSAATGTYSLTGTNTTDTFADTGLTSGTVYYYKISGVNSAGESILSSYASAITIPGIPTGAAVTAASCSSIALSWNSMLGASSYNVFHSTSAIGTFTKTGSSTSNAFSDTGLTANSTYNYKVSAVNITGESNQSASISVLTYPAKTVGLTLTATTNTSIAISWSAATGISSYKVYRSAGLTGTYLALGTTTLNSYTDSGLLAGTAYYYKVSAINATGESILSDSIASLTYPSAPLGLTAKSILSTKDTLTWTSISGVLSYKVYRSASATGTFSAVGSSASNIFGDTGLIPNTAYFYKISATNSMGESGLSSAITVTTTPAAPVGVTATGNSASSIGVTWTQTSGFSYKIYRTASATGIYAPIGTSSTNSFGDSALNAGTTYYYKVSAINASGESDLSSAVNATTYPAVPSALTIASALATKILLTWTTMPGAVSYTVFRNATANGTYTAISTPATNSYTDSGLTANTAYYYKVISVNSAGVSAPSGSVNTITLPAAPANVTVTGASASTDTITWTAITGLTYKVYRSSIASGTYSQVGASATSNFIDTGLTASMTYYYRVSAVNATGESDQSANEISFTTYSYALGQSYEGGIIYYVDSTGKHGLIAAPTDQGLPQWGCSNQVISGTSSKIGSGRANTIAIVNACSTPGIAASLCYDLTLGGYNDWFLPSSDELNLLYLNQNVVGGMSYNVYWSSTECGATCAVDQHFDLGDQVAATKSAQGLVSVRAVRAF